MFAEYQQQVARLGRAFVQDECGATAIEYGLIALGIGLAIISTASTVGDTLGDLFDDIGAALR